MSENIITVENLSKRYVIGHQRDASDGLRHRIEDAFRHPWHWFRSWSFGNRPRTSGLQTPSKEEFWALKDVSFEVRQGEVLGIIGRNGAGKSTLLKVLSQITEPTKGRIRIKGRVASLLEVGTGFHQELTGRENIFLNGAILGMTRAEIKKKFDEIVAFSEVERFLDTPVKRYSSGMYVRLAFAVAAHLEPEVLIIDEVLAVGDAEFQKKCLGKMQDVASGGRTVLFVSHNMGAVQRLCTSGICLEKGRLVCGGESKAIVNYYLESALPSAFVEESLSARTDRSGNGALRITSFWVEDVHGRRIRDAMSGTDVDLVLAYETHEGKDLRRVDPGISIHTETGETLFVLYSSYLGGLLDVKGPRGELRCRLERLPLNPGRYVVAARVTVNGEEADWPRDGIACLNVEAGDFYRSGSLGANGATRFLVSGMWQTRAAT